MALFVSRQTQKLYLPTSLPGVTEGDWVEVLTGYNADMRRRIMRRALSIKMGAASASAKDGSIEIDPFTYRQATAEEIITAWSEAISVSPEAIGEMRPEIQDWIAEQFDLIAAGRTEDEKKTSADNSESLPPPPTLISSQMPSGTY